MRNFTYIVISFLLASCISEDCKDHYLSNSDKSFIPYEMGDSIRVLSDKEDSEECVAIREFTVVFHEYDTLPVHDALGVNPCNGHYENLIVKIGYDEPGVYYPYTDFFLIKITRENGALNIRFNFWDNFLSNESYLAFNNSGDNENAKVYTFDDRIIDNKEYENVYLLVSTTNTNDSLYYSPNYGLIKLISETGTYTFENLN